MANEYETPAEREAKLNDANARINEAIAQDTAFGMAEKAAQERERANIYAAGNTHLNRELDSVRSQRNFAERDAVAARSEARGNAFGFWLMAGIVAAALFFGFFVWKGQGDETATASSAELPPTVVTKTVVAPTPAPTPIAPIAPPPPTVVHEYVPVPVPVAPAPVPEPAPLHGYTQPVRRVVPKPIPTTAPDTKSNNDGDQPLHGYVEP